MKSDPPPGPSRPGRTSIKASARSTALFHLQTGDSIPIVFGLLLGLAVLKFGTPVILNDKLSAPDSWAAFVGGAWPPMWGVWGVVVVACFIVIQILRRPGLVARLNPGRLGKWTIALCLIWFAWQFVAAFGSVDGRLSALTLRHFAACVICFFCGAFLFRSERAARLLLIGLLPAFAFCMVRAVDQRIVEFPRERQLLIEGERTGWTNVPPELFLQMREQNIVIQTNGTDVVNPIILAKYTKGRVHGTMFYPNALAGAVVLLFPMTLTFVYFGTQGMKPWIRWLTLALALFLGGGALFWSGSKSGWLIAVALAGLWVFRLDWPAGAKRIVLFTIIIGSLVIFGVRFRGYFSGGATSVGARFEYWRVAVRVVKENPMLGSGPGTFQRPHARLKSADSEMARLVHNDYLQQFSDSGIVGGLAYTGWIALIMIHSARRIWRQGSPLWVALLLGVVGWLLQGFSEFGLYIPALAWPAMLMAGMLVGFAALQSGNQVDNLSPDR